MIRSLDELRVEGTKTTAPFHLRALETSTFASGKMDTGFVEQELLGYDGLGKRLL